VKPISARHLTSSLLAAVILTGSSLPVLASAESDNLTTRIAQKEIELMQMTTRFRLNNKRETPAHKWAVAALSTVAYSVADAGNIVTFSNGFKYHTHPQNFSRGTAQSGPLLIFLGELFFLSRTLTATAIDTVDHIRIRNRGFDKETYERHAAELHQEIQALLEQRKQAIAADDATAQQEQSVLADLADAANREFINDYARVTQMQSFRFWDNVMANTTAASGAFAGALPTYLAAIYKRPRIAGTGGVGFIVSGSFFMADVALARVISLRMQKRSRRQLEARFLQGSQPPGDLRADLQRLSSISTSGASPAITAPTARFQSYGLMAKCLDEHAAMDKRDSQRDRRKFWHDQTWNMIEGGANFAAGTVIANAGYHFHPTRSRASQYYGARHFLTRFSWGAVAFTPSASGGIIDTPAEAIVTEVINHRDRKRGIYPDVILHERLNNLSAAAKLAGATE
jgi:hypothetical protein